jgi:hypothetical protein
VADGRGILAIFFCEAHPETKGWLRALEERGLRGILKSDSPLEQRPPGHF